MYEHFSINYLARTGHKLTLSFDFIRFLDHLLWSEAAVILKTAKSNRSPAYLHKPQWITGMQNTVTKHLIYPTF